MLDWRTGEACLIDYTESLGNIYESRSQTYCPKGKTYRDAQLGEHIHSVAVEHVSEHKVVCGSEPVGEKCGEGAVATIWWRHGRLTGCSLLLRPLPMARGTRRACHGSNVHQVDESETPRTTKNPLPGAPNVEVVL
jgi:hypothetical protein